MFVKKIDKYIFFALIFALTLFLYLNSPFNQKLVNPSISEIEYRFISFKFYFYSVWTVLFVFFFTLFKTKYKFMLYPFLIWNIIFFFLSLTVNYGFDLTDEGWQLSKSWGILHNGLKNNTDLIWGSSLMNGIWLSVIDSPLLIWSRFGYLIFLPFFGVVIFLILKEYFSDKKVFYSVIIAFFLFNKSFLIYSVANYYNLPVLMSLLSFLFLVKFHKSEISSVKYVILSGLFAGICIHLKFTYILIIPVFLLYNLYFNERKSPAFKTLLIYYSSLLSVLISGFLFLMLFNSADDLIYEHNRLSILDMFGYFFGTSTVNSSLNYSAVNLTNIYFKDFISVLNFALIPLLLFFISSYLLLKYSKLKFLLILLFGSFLYLYVYQNPSDSHLKIISAFLGFATYNLFFNKVDNIKLHFLYFLFICIFALSFLGSGTGFYGGVISLGFFGFSAFTLSTVSTLESEKPTSKIIFPALLIFALIAQFSINYSPYRDLPSPYLNMMFRSPELYGIYSFKERVDSVDEFINFAKKERIKNNKVIFVGMPMFYYILDVIPAISETHDVILGFEQLKNEVISAKPEIIVFPAQSPRGQMWPLEQNKDYWTKDGFERTTSHYYDFYRTYAADNFFEKIFENKMFIVYRKSGLLRE